jgi:alpha-beta hydrolase superfamily lysophospholipase
MGLKEVAFPSWNGRDTVKAWIYTPIRKPRGIVQVIHGLGEHSRRYFHLILRLNEAGFIVAADDHVGHGKTALDGGTWADYGNKGYMTTTEDEKSLHDLTVKDYPGLPYFMFGHSWGSMIARSFAAHYGSVLKGLVVCGTCGVMDSIPSVGPMLKASIDAGKGGERDPQYLGQMFTGWTDRYENPKTPNDWVSADDDIVADSIVDPFNSLSTHIPTNQANYDLVALVEAITGPKWAEKVPKNLPVYNIAGDQDPVGNYGEGVYQMSNWLANTGHSVSTKLYAGHRHEIHHDRDIREEVVDGVVTFLYGLL